MSGVLASIGSGGGILSGVLGLLRMASFRGVSFEMIDATNAHGRRWALFLFPGRDDTVQEDLGALDGPIACNIVLIGDDYVRRAGRLKKALMAPGPAMLRHPWLGQIKVTVCDPGTFSWDHQKGRMCTVSVSFHVWNVPPPAAKLTLGSLLDAIDQALDDVRAMVADVLAPLGAVLGLISTVGSMLSFAGGLFDSVFGGGGSGYGAAPGGAGVAGSDPAAVPGGAAVAAAAAAPLDAMTGGVALVPGPGLGGQAADLVRAVADAVALAGDPGTPPALGPGPAAAPAAPADARASAGVLLAVLPLLVPAPGQPAAAAVVLLGARVTLAVVAARAASLIAYTSRDEALAWRGRVDAALSGVQRDLVAAGVPVPGGSAALPALRTGATWRAVRAVRGTWGADMQELAGRLPPVAHLVTWAPMSAWTIAQAIAGDDPAAVRPAMLDLVARNRVRHPGRVPPGRLEILVPVSSAATASAARA